MWDLKWSSEGLISVVVQDRHSGEVRMLAHANEEALRRTLESGEGYFFSRSRQSLWKKGETSGNTLRVARVLVDCDGDTLLYLVDPEGPSCHTGAESCFFRALTLEGTTECTEAAPTLVHLERTLNTRTSSSTEKSYTKSLLDKGVTAIGEKINEEATELAAAIKDESEERVASESADLFYHQLVALLSRKLSWRNVLETLSARFNKSGHEEKARRP